MFKNFTFLGLVLVAIGVLSCDEVQAQTTTVVAAEDFDGGDINLLSGFDPATQNINVIGMPPFTTFGVFATGDFNGSLSANFALTDDSVADVSSGGANPPFGGDSEGIFGSNRDTADSFFAAASADSFDFDPSLLMGSWTFDISSATGDLILSVDMGQLSNDNFDGISGAAGDNFVAFEYSIDGGPFAEGITVAAADLVSAGFVYRAFDNGNEAEVDGFDMDLIHNGTRASGPSTVTKTRVDTGEVDSDTILDRTPANGPAAGLLDNYTTPIVGTGNTIEIRATFEFAFEAFAFDNLQILTFGDDKVLIGDVNCDGVIDLLDVAPFVELVLAGEFSDKADINDDGTVDLLDVAPFVDLLLSQ